MSIYLKEFSTHQEYEAFTATTAFIKPNVSICTTEGDAHYNPLVCEETTTYELVGTPSYPSEIEGCDTGFTLSFNYKKTVINRKCKEIVSTGSDSIVVETETNPSKANSRTINGNADYHGLEIPYSITQKPLEAIMTLYLNIPTTQEIYILNTFDDKYRYDYVQLDNEEKIPNSNFSTWAPSGKRTLEAGNHVFKVWLTDVTIAKSPQCSSYITGATIPNTVTTMSSTFSECTGLTRFDIPDSVTKLNNQTFKNCSALTAVTFSKNLTELGSQTFYNCRNLTGDIVLPDSVTSIGQASFNNCEKITSISIPEGVTVIKNATFSNCKELNDVTFPSTLTTIEGQAFSSCNGFRNLYIGKNLTNISNDAFDYCSKLTSIVVSDENTVYDSRNNCNALIETETNKLILGCKNTVIPNDIEVIGQHAFYGVEGITSVVLPNTVNSIGYYAFSRCYDLTSVTMSDNVTVINASAFQSCSGLSNCVLSNNVTELDSDMFNGCKSLTQLTLPSSLTIIGNGTFRGCGFSAVDIPSGVTSIDNYAFADCTNLRSLTVRATTPPTLYSTAMQGLSSELKIYVPAESVSAYKSASRWSTYGNQIYAIQ